MNYPIEEILVDDTTSDLPHKGFPRVYTYVDDDGVVYYSLTRSKSKVSPPKKLYLQGWVGTHALIFLNELRKKLFSSV